MPRCSGRRDFAFGSRCLPRPGSGAFLRPLVDLPEGAADPALRAPPLLRTGGAQESRTPGAGDCGAVLEAESSPRGEPHPGTAQAPQDLTQPSPLLENGRASGHMGVPWRPSTLLFLSFFWGETSEFL